VLYAFHGLRAQSRSPIQSFEDARDAVQTLHVGLHEVVTGSVDGHVRTYDLRKGQMTSDYMGSEYVKVIYYPD
jgi:mitogen-activated protein kinase organizer 1